SGGLKVQGKADGTLKVAASGTPMLLFKIGGGNIGAGEVSVMVFQRGESLGSIDVAIRTVAQAADTNPTSSTAQLQSPTSEQQPDLQVLVFEFAAGSYTMFLTAADSKLQ